MSKLKAWASEVAATVTEAVDGLHHLLHSLENHQTVLRASAARPGLVLVVADVKQGRGLASNDGHMEARESTGSNVDAAIDMTECLTWIGDTIEANLNYPDVLPKDDEA